MFAARAAGGSNRTPYTLVTELTYHTELEVAGEGAGEVNSGTHRHDVRRGTVILHSLVSALTIMVSFLSASIFVQL